MSMRTYRCSSCLFLQLDPPQMSHVVFSVCYCCLSRCCCVVDDDPPFQGITSPSHAPLARHSRRAFISLRPPSMPFEEAQFSVRSTADPRVGRQAAIPRRDVWRQPPYARESSFPLVCRKINDACFFFMVVVVVRNYYFCMSSYSSIDVQCTNTRHVVYLLPINKCPVPLIH
jgi:hypothetical protein